MISVGAVIWPTTRRDVDRDVEIDVRRRTRRDALRAHVIDEPSNIGAISSCAAAVKPSTSAYRVNNFGSVGNQAPPQLERRFHSRVGGDPTGNQRRAANGMRLRRCHRRRDHRADREADDVIALVAELAASACEPVRGDPLDSQRFVRQRRLTRAGQIHHHEPVRRVARASLRARHRTPCGSSWCRAAATPAARRRQRSRNRPSARRSASSATRRT